MFGDYRASSFSDTHERSRRAAAGESLMISLRFCFVFTNSGITKKARNLPKMLLLASQFDGLVGAQAPARSLGWALGARAPKYNRNR